MRVTEIAPTFEAWQSAARELLRAAVPPAEVTWREAWPGLGARARPAPAAPTSDVRVPARFMDLARQGARHPDPERWSVLYTMLWRITREGRDLLDDATDPEVRRFLALTRAPAGPGPSPRGRDGVDHGVQAAPVATSAAPFVPAGADLDGLRAAATRCTGCELYAHATQTVFGRGAQDARVVLVGEQPGDQEDRQGAPFVGPAGEVLDRALAEVGLPREQLYVTNVVKHFKFEQRGKRRIHQTPRASEINACRPWIEAELALIRPEVLVCLGATAARALISPDFRILKERGRFASSRWAPKTLATLHPSAVLRGEDDADQARLYAMLVEDLRQVASVLR
jgi:uracil-DNA glycosylase family protein